MSETLRETSRSSCAAHADETQAVGPTSRDVSGSTNAEDRWPAAMNWPSSDVCSGNAVPAGSCQSSRSIQPSAYGAVEPLARTTETFNGPWGDSTTQGCSVQSPGVDAIPGQIPPDAPHSQSLPAPYSHAMPAPCGHMMPAPYGHAMPEPYGHAMPAPYGHTMPAPYGHAVPAPYGHAMPAPYAHAMPAPYGLGSSVPSEFMGHAPGALGAIPAAMGAPAPYANSSAYANAGHSNSCEWLAAQASHEREGANCGVMAGGILNQRAPESLAPYAASSAAPAFFAGSVAPYAAQPAMAAPYSKRDLGWSMWRFDGQQWELVEDCSAANACPRKPEAQRGRFVGQVVRTPSVWSERREKVASLRSFSTAQVDDLVLRATHVPGYASDSELRWFVGAASSLEQGATWVEIGALCGRSFLAVGLSLPQGATLISIDTLMGMQKRQGITMLDTYEELARERPDLQITLMRCSSTSASRLIREQSCDVVYVDGDHSGPAVQSDIVAWTPNLKPGGMMCGHDYGEPEYPDVKVVVDSLPHSTVAVGSIWVWHP